MTDHRIGRFRNGTSWCSKEEIDRLRREAIDDPEARAQYKRLRTRCGIPAKEPSISIDEKHFGARYGLPEDEQEIQDLIVQIIENATEDGLSWHMYTSMGINMFQGRAKRSWHIRIEVPYKRRNEEGLSVSADLEAVADALQKIAKKRKWVKTAIRSHVSGKDYGYIEVSPRGVF